ncbi:MAG: cbbY [Chlamydiales bacterium]|nr:cbbY [Chlamydiales bacterium]
MKAIIFDCDGVLADTEILKFKAWQDVFEQHSLTLTIDEYRQVAGHTSERILQELSQMKGISIPLVVIKEKQQLYKQIQQQGVPPIQPAIDYLKLLYEAKAIYGFKLGLASSASHAEINTNLTQLGISHVFDSIVSGKDDLSEYQDSEGTNKPKPYIYREIAKRLNISPSDCVVFEDSGAGIEAAYAAGCYPIAVPNTITEDHDFSKAAYILYYWDQLSIRDLCQIKKANLSIIHKE